MRRLLCTLIFLAAASLAPAWAQRLALSPADVADASALARTLPGLARAALAQSPAAAESETGLITRMRLQLVAGEFASALDTIQRLRALQAAPEPGFLQYALYAQARRDGQIPFEDAFDAGFRTAFAALSDRQAYRAAQAFAYDLPQSWQGVQRQVATLSFDANGTVPLTQALDLLRTYQPYQAYSALLPRVPALLEADEQRRYQREQVAIKGPDGATLTAFVLLPRGAPGPRPAALVFTIYAEADRPWRPAVQAAAHGYAGVIAFSRGKLASPDRIAPYEHEAHDVNTVIDWVARQPWNNGAVGMYGGSYDGFAQWAALKKPHPALKTIVPYVAAIPGLGVPMENNVGLTANYGWAFYVGNTPTLDNQTYNDRARWNALADRWFESGRPYREIDQVDGTPNPWLQRWLAHPDYDAYWQAMVPVGREFAKIDIPVLSITGYYDDGQISAIEYLKQHEAWHPNPRHVLLIGPYDHIGAQSARKPALLRGLAIDAVAQIDTPALTFAWLDHVLRGAPRPALLKDRINFEVMGANRWAQAPSLKALNAGATKFYLSPAAAGQALHRLSSSKPARPGALEQHVDFHDRKTSGNDYYPFPIVRRELDLSSGYTFVSEPLKTARVLAGNFSGQLKIRINKRDVDLGVVLYELTPEGDYVHLSYFLGRASYAGDMSRRRLLTPGQLTTVPFSRTRMVARELRAGSRLVVQVNVNKNSGAQLNMGSGKDVSDEGLADASEPLRVRWYGDSYVSVPLREPK